jgi:hypothetical protein
MSERVSEHGSGNAREDSGEDHAESQCHAGADAYGNVGLYFSASKSVQFSATRQARPKHETGQQENRDA